MEEKKTKKRIVAKLKHSLPSYKITFEKHFEILKAYVVASKEGKEPLSWKDFQKIVSINSHYVSANNKFLEELGLIKEAERKPGKYSPTEKTVEFSKAKDWDEEQAKSILRKLVSSSWFWQSTKQLLDIRGKIPKNDLISKFGVDSGADPKKHFPSLNILVEYLKYVELINEENGTITYGKFGLERIPAPEIKLPESKDTIQIALGDELFAVDIKEFEAFVREKGKKLDHKVYRIK